jgi:hypothetical protein
MGYCSRRQGGKHGAGACQEGNDLINTGTYESRRSLSTSASSPSISETTVEALMSAKVDCTEHIWDTPRDGLKLLEAL